MNRRVHLTNTLLPVQLFVYVGEYEACQRFLRRRFDKEWDDRRGAAKAAVLPAPKGVGFECVIWMPYFRRGNAFDAGKLAHEALHVVWRLLEHLGIYDEETHCYLLQWIVDEVTDRLT